jgi:hypothetical protein
MLPVIVLDVFESLVERAELSGASQSFDFGPSHTFLVIVYFDQLPGIILDRLQKALSPMILLQAVFIASRRALKVLCHQALRTLDIFMELARDL